MHEPLNKKYEDLFRILEPNSHVKASCNASKDCPSHGRACPGCAYCPGPGNVFWRVDGHEPCKYVWLAKVAKAPSAQGDGGSKGGEPVAIRHEGAKEFVGGATKLMRLHFHEGHEGHYQEGKKHEGCLEGVGPGHGQKSPHEGVDQYGEGPKEHGRLVGNGKDGIKQLSPGNKARACVDSEEKEYHQGGKASQYACFV